MNEQAKSLASSIQDRIDAGLVMPIILIDGRAGSGKSTLAAALQNELFRLGESAPRVVHMDDLYAGWNGLADGADFLQRFILQPLLRGEVASWQEWDWAAGSRSGQWREFSGGTPLIVEGCGSLNARTAEFAQFRVWLEVPEEIRYERWVAREGNDEFWASWSAQEIDFYAREKSSELADTVFSPGTNTGND